MAKRKKANKNMIVIVLLVIMAIAVYMYTKPEVNIRGIEELDFETNEGQLG